MSEGDITSAKKVAIFGATGYVGLMLVNRLIREKISLTLFVRNKRRLKHLKESQDFTLCDSKIAFENLDVIAEQLADVEVVYYLINSLSHTPDGLTRPGIELAEIVSSAAEKAGVRQIIYLGELGVEKEGFPLSEHLRCRLEIGSGLRNAGVPVTEIRAGVIIGAGSVSFEIIQALSKKLPFMPGLTFNTGRCQPIDIDDVINYMFHVYMHPSFMGQIVEVGMEETFNCDEMVVLFAKYSHGRKLSRLQIPFLDRLITKKVMARVIAFLSAIPYELAFPLVDDMDSLSIKGDHAYEEYDTSCPLPAGGSTINTLMEKDLNLLRPISFSESVKKASKSEAEGRVESYWSMPHELQVLPLEDEEFLFSEQYEKDGLLFEKRVREVPAGDADSIFTEVKQIGGEHGYWSPQWMWSSRALMDKLIGGPGLDLGRRTFGREPRVGERLDFWIVTDYQDTKQRKVLTLKGRLKSPGDSWLQFILVQNEEDPTVWRFTLRAYFEPTGVAGYLYWYSLFFVHKYIFTAMIEKIIKNAGEE